MRFSSCLFLVLLATWVVPVARSVHAAEVPAVRPHIIFILADDMGMGDLGCYGGKQAPTPRLDRLASEGMRFTQYYSASPVCSPSRVGLLTGMFPARWRLTNYLQTRDGNRKSEQADFLDPQSPSVARQLKAAGYATGHFGKWHLGGGRDVKDAPKISAYGFDEYASTWESPEPHPDIETADAPGSPPAKVKRWERTGYFVDRALDFLKRHKEQPCFIQIWPDDIHTPWVPDAAAKRGATPANLHPVLAETDRQLGRLFDGVRELGIDSDTLILFASDNGPMPTFDGARSAGMRGAKWSLYEAGIRLPFIVRWPGRIPAGKVDESTVFAAVDLLPSLCAIAGAKLPDGTALDGQDLSGAWSGRPVVRNHPLFWEYGRNGNTFMYPAGRDRSPNVAVREGSWKLLLNADGSSVELYDLAADRAEQHNLAAERPDIAKRLSESALRWRKSMPIVE
jgi:arylsulfatase A-like enzyme